MASDLPEAVRKACEDPDRDWDLNIRWRTDLASGMVVYAFMLTLAILLANIASSLRDIRDRLPAPQQQEQPK